MSIVVWDSSFEGVFLDENSLRFGLPFGYLGFLYAFVHFHCKSVVYGGEFFKPKSVSAIKASSFLVSYLFMCCLKSVGVYAHLRAFEHLQLFFHNVYLFGFFVMTVKFRVCYTEVSFRSSWGRHVIKTCVSNAIKL